MRPILLLLLSAVFTIATAQNGYFINPPAMVQDQDKFRDFYQNQQWQLDTEQTVRWGWNLDPFDAFYIQLYQITLENGPQRSQDGTLIYHKEKDIAGSDSFVWRVNASGFGIQNSPMFVLLLWENNTNPLHRQGFPSHYFNITTSAPASTSTSAGSTDLPSTSLPATDVSSGSIPSATAGPSTSPSTNDQPQSGAPPDPTSDKSSLRLALGIGIGVGVPLVLFVGILVGLRIVRARRASTPPSEAPPMEQESKTETKWDDPAPRYSYVAGHTVEAGPAELPAPNQNRISELY